MTAMRPLPFIVCFLFLLTVNTFAAPPLFRQGDSFFPAIETQTHGATLGDLDGDGDPDLVMANEGANTVWFNNGLGGFTDSGQQLGDASSFGVALGDINVDTDVDAVFANHGISLLWNNDGGIYIEQPSQDDPWIDSDAKEGIPITFDGPGDGTRFVSEQEIQDGTANACALAYLNTDDYLDLVFANTGANTVWLNDGQGSFYDSLQSLGSSVSTGVALGYLNGDRYIDAVFSNSGANTIWFNDGLGTMLDSGQRLGNRNSLGVALADVDGDGDTDIVFANDGPDTVWLNNGLNIFLDSGQSLGNTRTQSVSLADVDNDGDMDILASTGDPEGASDQDYPDVLWLNDGQGNFEDSGLSFNTNNSICAFLTDLDNDGDQDVLSLSAWPSAHQVWIQISLPDVRSGTVEESDDMSISFWAILVNLGDHSVSDHGFVWNTTGEPDMNDIVVSLGQASSNGIFRTSFSVEDDTVYYFRPYATNGAGTNYGKTVTYDSSVKLESDCFIGTAFL